MMKKAGEMLNPRNGGWSDGLPPPTGKDE